MIESYRERLDDVEQLLADALLPASGWMLEYEGTALRVDTADPLVSALVHGVGRVAIDHFERDGHYYRVGFSLNRDLAVKLWTWHRDRLQAIIDHPTTGEIRPVVGGFVGRFPVIRKAWFSDDKAGWVETGVCRTIGGAKRSLAAKMAKRKTPIDTESLQLVDECAPPPLPSIPALRVIRGGKCSP